jgi:hypothetical protein
LGSNGRRYTREFEFGVPRSGLVHVDHVKSVHNCTLSGNRFGTRIWALVAADISDTAPFLASLNRRRFSAVLGRIGHRFFAFQVKPQSVPFLSQKGILACMTTTYAIPLRRGVQSLLGSLLVMASAAGTMAAQRSGTACQKTPVAKNSGQIMLWRSGNAIGSLSPRLAVGADGAPNSYRVYGNGLSDTCDGVVALVDGRRVTPETDGQH